MSRSSDQPILVVLMTKKRAMGSPSIFILVCASILGGLPTTLVLPSLPDIAAEFGASDAAAQLIISSFLFTSALIMLIAGPLSDRYGRRPVMLGAILIFLVGSLISLFAPTIEVAIFGRIMQATSFSTVVVSRAVIRDMYGTKESASKIGYLTMGMAIGLMIAPMLGGVLVEAFHWRANFIVLILAGITMLVLLYLTLGETNKSEFSTFKSQLKEYPELFRSRRFWALTLAAAFNTGTYYAFLGGGAFVAYTVLNLTPTSFGAFFAFLTIGYMLGNFLSGRFSVRVGMNRMALTGTIITVIGSACPIVFLAMGLTHPVYVFVPMFFMTMGNGLTLPNITAAMVSIRPNIAGTASGLGGTIQFGGASAISVLTAMWGGYLFIVMTLSALIGTCFILYVIARSRSLGENDPQGQIDDHDEKSVSRPT